MLKIGFIGLGHMGLPMVSHLLNAQHEVTAFDTNPEAQAAFRAMGGKTAQNLQILAEQKDVIITMLPRGEHVWAVCMSANGIYQHAKGALHIDCSSIDLATTARLHASATQQGLRMVDAPVSGGVAGAKAGTITFMVGGLEADYQTALPLLSLMGKQVFHTGAAGTGQMAKLCNNMILGVSMIAVSEAFVLARQLGLSDKALFDVVTHASGQCWTMSNYPPVADLLPNVPANHQYQPGFTSAMMLKDLTLGQDAAHGCGVSTPLGEHAKSVYEAWVSSGHAELDFSSIIQAIQKKMGV